MPKADSHDLLNPLRYGGHEISERYLARYWLGAPCFSVGIVEVVRNWFLLRLCCCAVPLRRGDRAGRVASLLVVWRMSVLALMIFDSTARRTIWYTPVVRWRFSRRYS